MEQPISVVIPVGPDDQAWTELLPQLELARGSEIIFAVGANRIDLNDVEVDEGLKLVTCHNGRGRAAQMNAGARMANSSILWFLHADTRLGSGTLEKLDATIAELRDALYFFDLKFLDDGPSAMVWNEWAVRWRAGLLKMPFGDQGFCMPRDLFFTLGGYREDLAYGEDHVFVWKTRQEGYPVFRIAAPLYTSARKYRAGGWVSTTGNHVWLTIKQSVPQMCELMRRNLMRIFS